MLTSLRGAHIAGKTLFWGISVRVFPEEISILAGRLSKEDQHQQRDGLPSALIQSVRA